VIGELPPGLLGGDGGALLRLLQARQQQQQQMPPQQQQQFQPPPPNGYGDVSRLPGASAAAAAAAAAAALAGLRMYPQGPGARPSAGPGFNGVPFPSFGAIGAPMASAAAQWGGPPVTSAPLPAPQHSLYAQPQQQQQPLLQGTPPPPHRVPPAPRPPAGSPAPARTAPMVMPQPRAPPPPSPGGGMGETPPRGELPFGRSPPTPIGRSPPTPARVNQRDVREADRAGHAADRDDRSGGGGGGGGGGGARGGWGGGRGSRGAATLKADAVQLSARVAELAASLQPAAADTARQQLCFERVRAMVQAEWPDAQLLMYGSCANGFGGAASDIDTCLALRWADGPDRKRAVVQRIAELATAAGCTGVVALTHARMPVAKMVEPQTGVACDVCVNNFLAVYNTRLLRDYASLDPRLRQLGYVVKHWAKRRSVNEPYTGTLSSYCYILMCIHLLQTRQPAVLPCLQNMSPQTFSREVEGTRCSYYDDVRALQGWGDRNSQPLAQLLHQFFEYWAWEHDYGGAVASVRTGGFVSKRRKGWTTRVGTERHLICIEDPFEISHDLGRVVDKRSINVLRDEFARAAQIMRTSSSPLDALFQEYSAPSRGLPPAGEAEPALRRQLVDSLPESL
jgi:hypothetical protein